EVRLIPGAREFIESAEKMGVTVVYISNRVVNYESSTIAALKHVGLNTRDIEKRILLREQSSDKTSRRQIAQRRYRVLIYFGDNLRDCSEEFAAPKIRGLDDNARRQTIEDRYAAVQRNISHWGIDWIVLPNPVYGEWQKLLGKDPHRDLRETNMRLPTKQ